MIIKIEKQNGIDIIYVRADIPDEEMEKLILLKSHIQPIVVLFVVVIKKTY
jgi:hypothetical protein